jgi:hypothetical protein
MGLCPQERSMRCSYRISVSLIDDKKAFSIRAPERI